MAMRVVGLLVLICAAECVTAGASKLNDTSPINKLENLQDGWAIVLPEEEINGLTFKRTVIRPYQIANGKTKKILRQVAQVTDPTWMCGAIMQSSDDLLEAAGSLRGNTEYDLLACNIVSLVISASARIVANPQGKNTDDIIEATMLLSDVLKKKELWCGIIFDVVACESVEDCERYCTAVARNIDSYRMWLCGDREPGRYFVKADQLKARYFREHGLPINPLLWALGWGASHR